MKLGGYAHFSFSVNKLKESIAFYEKLGFKSLWGNSHPHPWHLMTDGGINIHLYEFRFPSPAIHYFSINMDARVRELSRTGVTLTEEKSKDGRRTQHSFLDPNEIHVMLMHHDDATMPKPDGTMLSRLGTFGEFSINTDDITTSLSFWQGLGFSERLSGSSPYPWKIISDDVISIGLHQTATFHAAALTYFAPTIADAIEHLKYHDIPLTKEITDRYGIPEGAIFNSPDGQIFFVLKGK